MHSGIASLAVIGVLIVAGLLARLCVAGLVRNSIRRGVKIAADLLRHRTVDAVSPSGLVFGHGRARPEPCSRILIVQVVGFSWGGGVAAELLRQGKLGADGAPSALLLAPTTCAMARCALQV